MVRINRDEWRPHEREGRWQSVGKLAAGDLVILDRAPYRVIETRVVEQVDWREKTREQWVEHGMPDPATWPYRPIVFVVRHDDRPEEKPQHFGGSAGAMVHTLPEHYAVCRRCGELPPCREVHNNTIAERAADVLAEQMAILPGCCHDCNEPITRRQKSFTFPGPNLIRPDLGDNSARFHMRGSCYSGRVGYDQRWAQVTGRRRFFACDGRLVQHYDGTAECSDPECLGTDLEHQQGEYHRRYPDMRGVAWSGCWCLPAVPKASGSV